MPLATNFHHVNESSAVTLMQNSGSRTGARGYLQCNTIQVFIHERRIEKGNPRAVARSCKISCTITMIHRFSRFSSFVTKRNSERTLRYQQRCTWSTSSPFASHSRRHFAQASVLSHRLGSPSSVMRTSTSPRLLRNSLNSALPLGSRKSLLPSDLGGPGGAVSRIVKFFREF